jgi:hypothetical protein
MLIRKYRPSGPLLLVCRECARAPVEMEPAVREKQRSEGENRYAGRNRSFDGDRKLSQAQCNTKSHPHLWRTGG